MNSFWLAAGVASLATNALHIWLGGREIARRLLDAPDLHPVVKWTTYYCWHMATVAMTVMSAMFLAAGLEPQRDVLAVPALALAAGFCVLSIGVVTVGRQPFQLMSQWSLFLVITTLGGAGFLT